jgi:hypothetical protein
LGVPKEVPLAPSLREQCGDEGEEEEGGESEGDELLTNFATLLLHAPLIFFSNLCFLCGGEIINNSEMLSDFFRSFPFDHAGDCGTGEVKKWFDVHVVGCRDELKKHFLININESCIPLLNNIAHIGRFEGLTNVMGES